MDYKFYLYVFSSIFLFIFSVIVLPLTFSDAYTARASEEPVYQCELVIDQNGGMLVKCPPAL